MICPNCRSDTLNQEKDIVICSNCGFRTTFLEYNVWTKIHKSRPQRIVFHEDERMYAETYTAIRDFLNDKYVKALVFGLLLVIILIIIALM